jgi:hypothetical protein
MSNRTALLAALTSGKPNDDLSKIRQEMLSAGSVEAKVELLLKLVEAREKALPEFARWYELERNLVALLLAPYLLNRSAE